MKRRLFAGFSGRTDFGPTDPTYARQKARARLHESFIDLTASNPRSAGISLPHPLEWLENSPPGYEPHPRGLETARAALATAYSMRAPIDANSFLLTASTSEAYSFVLQVLCDPGDRILVPAPSYPLFEQLSQLAGVELVRYRIAYDGAFYVDLGSLPTRQQAEALGVRAIFAVSPNNPTGNSLSEEELERFRSLELPLVIDEVFRPFSRCTATADPLADSDDQDLLVVVDGLSKRAGAPGLKLGWLLARGRRAAAFLERAEWVSDAFLSAGSLVQHGLPRILEEEQVVQRSVISRIEHSRRLISGANLQTDGITELRTDGGWTALLQLPKTSSEEEWWETLTAEGLWLLPGRLYDLEHDATFALSLLTPPHDLSLALERLRKIVRQHQ